MQLTTLGHAVIGALAGAAFSVSDAAGQIKTFVRMLLAAAVRAADVDRGFFCEACRIHRMLQYHCFKVREKSLEDLKHAAKARETIQASNKHACMHRSTTNVACCMQHT